MLGDGFDGLFKNGKVVGVGKQVAVVEHVDPNFSVRNDLGGKGFLDDLTRRHR